MHLVERMIILMGGLTSSSIRREESEILFVMVARYKKWQPPSSHVHEPGGQTDGRADGKCSVILFSQTTNTRGLVNVTS